MSQATLPCRSVVHLFPCWNRSTISLCLHDARVRWRLHSRLCQVPCLYQSSATRLHFELSSHLRPPHTTDSSGAIQSCDCVASVRIDSTVFLCARSALLILGHCSYPALALLPHIGTSHIWSSNAGFRSLCTALCGTRCFLLPTGLLSMTIGTSDVLQVG